MAGTSGLIIRLITIDAYMRTLRAPPLTTIDAYMRNAHLVQRNAASFASAGRPVFLLFLHAHEGRGFKFMNFAPYVDILVCGVRAVKV